MFHVLEEPCTPGSLEFVEKKGRGHPDSLADALAEIISYTYGCYCIENFGAVLHHYVDKLTILGGEAQATFGRYRQVSPIRVLLNGRFSRSFGRHEIPLVDIARSAISAYLPLVFPEVDDTHWKIVDNTNPARGSSAKGWHWWAPRDLADVPDTRHRRSNDTSVSVASAPLTPVEGAVVEAERLIFEKLCLPGQCGSDVKLLAARTFDTLEVTACVPVKASAVTDRGEYDVIKDNARELLEQVFRDIAGIDSVVTHVNTRDDAAPGDIYLLGLGTALEHGDEGVVGRGNRTNGLITTETPMSLDAPWGKNPVYFTGRVYDTCARRVSETLWSVLGVRNSTYLASQNGRTIENPWQAVIRAEEGHEAGTSDIGDCATEAFRTGLTLEAQMAEIRGRHPHLPAPRLQ